jgi:hypothetical protein
VTVEPVGRWKVSAATPSERGYFFRFYPTENWTQSSRGEWATVVIENVYKMGSDEPLPPIRLRVFKYGYPLQDSHPYLVTCWNGLHLPEEGH